MKQSKPIIMWLRDLPEGYSQRAIRNASEVTKYELADSLPEAILSMADWNATNEGYKFWDNVTAHYEVLHLFPTGFIGRNLGQRFANRYFPLPSLSNLPKHEVIYGETL
jgi:hypothetical protein